MKLKFYVLTILACAGYLLMCGYHLGPGSVDGYDCTGAETALGNPTGCSCHNAFSSTDIDLHLELDSGGMPVTHYTGGLLYTVKLTGTNNGANSLPKFGFQIASILGSVPKATPVNKGIWSAILPSGTHIADPQPGFFVVRVVEHSNALAATTGNGGTGTTYSRSFTWTAPATGTGTISFWAALNAVNGNEDENGDYWDTTHLVIDERPINSGLKAISESIGCTTYPNPVNDILHLRVEVSQAGTYALSVYNLSGINMTKQKIEMSAVTQTISLNTRNWTQGIYYVVLQNGNLCKAFSIVKQ